MTIIIQKGETAHSFYVPDDIMTGLKKGTLIKTGGVVRTRSGQIYRHLKPATIRKTNKKSRSVWRNKTVQLSVAGGVGGLIGLSVAWYQDYHSRKQREAEIVSGFQDAFGEYINSIQGGIVTENTIDNLMISLSEIKTLGSKNQFMNILNNNLGVMLQLFHEYTMKLSKDNDFEIEEDCLDENNNAITNFQHYLKIQKKIFESAA